MSTSEVWTGTGLTMTMIPESKLFLGYMPFGPTLGRDDTTKANLIKYSVGFSVDGNSVTMANILGEGTPALNHFSEKYHLVPGLYAGCTAEFWYTTDSSTAATLQFTATVADNDVDAIYFAGNIDDFPTLWAVHDDMVGTASTKLTVNPAGGAGTAGPRGYIMLQKHGAVVPAPLTLEQRITALSDTIVAGEPAVICTAGQGDVENIKAHDLMYSAEGELLGRGWGINASGTSPTTRSDGTTSSTHIHPISGAIDTADDQNVGTTSNFTGIYGIKVNNADLRGTFTAGDFISGNAVGTLLGVIYHTSYDGTNTSLYVARVGTSTISDTNNLFWGRDMAAGATTGAVLSTGAIRTLSDNWLGLVETATPANTTVEVLQQNMAIGGTRNFTHQLKGMESAEGASLDINVNHGTWLHYALGATALTFPTVVGEYITDPFDIKHSITTTGAFAASTNRFTYASGANFSSLEVGMTITITNAADSGNNATVTIDAISADTGYLTLSAVDADESSDEITITVDSYPTTEHKTLVATNGSTAAVAGNSNGPFFHRVLKGSDSICPPLLPGTAAKVITEPVIGTDGLLDYGLTYTFSERNDSTLPSFAFELVAEKGSNVASIPQVDRGTTARQDSTTFDTKDTAYAQIHPGATMESFSLTAAADAMVKSSMSFNVKRTFECPVGYIGRAYDATNNVTSGANLPRVLNNFGQNTGLSTATTQEFITPYFFSDGTISLFGSEFMKVSNFSLNVSNGLMDKRYIGQYNKQIKNVVTGQRTYTIEMTALLSDRRLFAELRNEDSFRNAMSHSNIQLLLSKPTGERIKLQFDDFMVSVANFPGPSEERGPLEVSFTIMPLRTGTAIDTVTGWVLQG